VATGIIAWRFIFPVSALFSGSIADYTSGGVPNGTLSSTDCGMARPANGTGVSGFSALSEPLAIYLGTGLTICTCALESWPATQA
jgi:hypothetical protein